MNEKLQYSDMIEDELNDIIGFRRPFNCYDDCKHCVDGEDYDECYEYVCSKHKFIICDPMRWVCNDINKK